MVNLSLNQLRLPHASTLTQGSENGPLLPVSFFLAVYVTHLGHVSDCSIFIYPVSAAVCYIWLVRYVHLSTLFICPPCSSVYCIRLSALFITPLC
jgi:hypothetical protein